MKTNFQSIMFGGGVLLVAFAATLPTAEAAKPEKPEKPTVMISEVFVDFSSSSIHIAGYFLDFIDPLIINLGEPIR